MKNHVLNFLAVLLVSFVVTNCSNSDDSDSNSNFEVNIDGREYTASVVVSQMTNGGAYIAITATNPTTTESVGVSIGDISDGASPLAVGTYEISEGSNAFLTYGVASDGNSYLSESGQVVITALNTENKTISGTFQGVVSQPFGSTETFELTSGKFTNLEYIIP